MTQQRSYIANLGIPKPGVRKLGAILLGIMAALVLLVIITIIFSEPLVRWVVENRGSSATGRELRIDGPLGIDWGWKYASVQAKHIRLGNAESYREPDMVSIESLELTLKPWALLVGRLELGSVRLEKPVIILEQKNATDANWHFSNNDKGKNDANDESFLSRVSLEDRMDIKNGRLVYRNAVRELELDLKLDSLQVEDKPEDDRESEGKHYEFTLSGNGKLHEHPLSIDSSFDYHQSLFDPTADFSVRLKLNMGETQVDLEGVFKDAFKLGSIDADLKIAGANMADLFYLTAIPLPPTPEYTLQGRLTKEGGIWEYKGFAGEVGQSDLSGELSYDVSGTRGFLTANLRSNVLDSADLGGFIGLPPERKNDPSGTPEQESKDNMTENNDAKENQPEKKAVAEEGSNGLIPDVPLRVERLRATDLDVTLTAKKISAPNVPFKGMDVRFYLKDGVLKLDPFDAILADGTVDGTIEIDARTDVPPMAMKLNLRNLNLHRFFENTRFADTTNGMFGGNISLSGKGASLAGVLGTSNGDISVIISGGKISLLLIEASDVDIGEALPLLLGKDKSTDIRCGVADFDVKDGELNANTFVLDTTDSTLVGDINIDLQNEKIEARLDAKPKDASLLSARIPITLSGDLKSPSIGLDKEKAGKRGVAAIALGTLFTPFAALLAFVDTGSNTQDADCRALIAAAKSQ